MKRILGYIGDLYDKKIAYNDAYSEIDSEVTTNLFIPVKDIVTNQVRYQIRQTILFSINIRDRFI